MNKWKLSLFVFSATISFNALALSDTPKNRDLEARRFESTVDTRAQLQETMKLLGSSMSVERPAMSVFFKFVQDEIITDDFVKTIESQNHQAYIENFTADELKLLADFYSSPEGQAIIKKMPGVRAKLMPMTMLEIVREVKEKRPILDQRIREYKAAHPDEFTSKKLKPPK